MLLMLVRLISKTKQRFRVHGKNVRRRRGAEGGKQVLLPSLLVSEERKVLYT